MEASYRMSLIFWFLRGLAFPGGRCSCMCGLAPAVDVPVASMSGAALKLGRRRCADAPNPHDMNPMRKKRLNRRATAGEAACG